jgi:hypothetical protein
MLQSTIAYTDLLDSQQAGNALGHSITSHLDKPANVVIVFAAPNYQHETLLKALQESCHPEIIVGCSSAGEFTGTQHGNGRCCAIALVADQKDMHFKATVGHNISTQLDEATQSIATTLQSGSYNNYRHHTALLLADALTGHMEELLGKLVHLTDNSYEFFGGGAGDNAQFQHTPVFFGTEVLNDAAVVLAFDSTLPIGVGMCHGWQPASDYLQVTKAEGKRLIEIDHRPAIEAFKELAAKTEQILDLENPLPFFLHTLIGIDGEGYRLRVPLALQEDGSIYCAAEVPQDSMISLMKASSHSPIEAAATAAQRAQRGLAGHKPSVALFFDCVATRLVLGKDFGLELEALQETLDQTPLVGCNSHGQFARVHQQYSAFHNCTAVVGLFPTFE